LLAGCAGPGAKTPPLHPVETGAGPTAGPGRLAIGPRGPLDALKGLTAPQVERLFGPASFRRVDPPAEIWQYRGATCILDLFLYPEGATMQVAHAQARQPTGGAADLRACLDAQVAARPPAP